MSDGAREAPPHVALGIGAGRGAPADEILTLVAETLRDAGLDAAGVTELATVDTKSAEPGLRTAAERLGLPLRTFPAEVLAAVEVPNPSGAPRAAVGTASVAEAAALCAAATAAAPYEAVTLLVPKRKSARATAAVARRGPADTRMPVPDDTADPDGPAAPTDPREPDLRHHGDAEVRDADAALTDLAVNVRAGTPPAWLRSRIAASLDGLAAYPDGRAARRAVAERHGLPEECVLLTSGAAEAFVLLARALPAAEPAVVHPQFTEPEAALRDAGRPVRRVLLSARSGFRLAPGQIPDSADLVLMGNPTNPTSVLHPAAVLESLARPRRTLVVDEAFMDAVPGERESLASRVNGMPGRLVVLRSLTKTWGLAGLRIGYVLSDPRTIEALARHQPLWPVSSPALTAAIACSEPDALAEAERAAEQVTADRVYLLDQLEAHTALRAVRPAEAPFVLVRHPHAETLRSRMRELGFALRRGDTFPGLGTEWLRLAVRDRETTDRLVRALSRAGACG